MLYHPNKPPSPVLGVLTPHTGGFYYGTVTNGVLKAARELGAVAVAFETSRLELLRDGQILSSAWVDGWLAINEFHDSALVNELRRQNKLLVHVHSSPESGVGSSVLPDNEGGTRALTEHLFSHGHRRIAFAGNLSHVDVAGRYAGYLAALAGAGLAVGPVFDTPHHKEVDGRFVADRLLEGRRDARHPNAGVTALVAATDRLALGAMARLTEAGLRLPDDFAIVGFDDADAAQFAEPALTTVKQNFADVAATAVRELVAAIQGRARLKPLLRVETRPILRRSCGCLISHSRPPNFSNPSESRADVLCRELLALGSRNRRTPMTLAEWPAARDIATILDRAANDPPSPGSLRGELWAGLLAESRDAESAVRVMELLESSLRTWQLEPESHPQAWGVLRDLRVALLHQWQRAERTMVAHYETVTESAYRLAGALSGSILHPSHDLTWIRWSNTEHAACAIWKSRLRALESPSSVRASLIPASSRTSLTVTGEYTKAEGEVRIGDRRETLACEHFPPRALLETAEREGAILTIASVPSERGDEFGILAVVAPLPFEQLEYVGTPGDWAVQLGAALDRAVVEKKLRANAELDGLTGLANRATLLARVEQLLEPTSSDTFALLFVDLDDFKKVNDSLGHEAGDQLLIQISERLTAEVFPLEALEGSESTSKNLVARVGGDEFVIVLAGVDDESRVASFAERLQRSLKQPFDLVGSQAFVSASIGVTFGRSAESTAHELLRDADTAMYRAKTKGRARYEIFHHRMHRQAVEKLHMDAQLRLALERDQLELWYQPIVELSSGIEVGAEALVRWRHPDQGLLPPGRFLSVADEVGLAIPMSEWVIQRACRDAAGFCEVGNPNAYVNVNVPAAHIKQAGFVEFVEQALRAHGLRPSALGVEIVESALLDEPQKSAFALSRLMAMGVRVAIDDFGTGYSSLSYLRDFPVTTLKIDRSFIKNVPGELRDNGITRAIITMGRGLGLNLVAEGIETREQLDFLREAGCDYAQGYYLCMPLEPSAYRRRLSENQSIDPLPLSRPSHLVARAAAQRH